MKSLCLAIRTLASVVTNLVCARLASPLCVQMLPHTHTRSWLFTAPRPVDLIGIDPRLEKWPNLSFFSSVFDEPDWAPSRRLNLSSQPLYQGRWAKFQVCERSRMIRSCVSDTSSHTFGFIFSGKLHLLETTEFYPICAALVCGLALMKVYNLHVNERCIRHNFTALNKRN